MKQSQFVSPLASAKVSAGKNPLKREVRSHFGFDERSVLLGESGWRNRRVPVSNSCSVMEILDVQVESTIMFPICSSKPKDADERPARGKMVSA